MKLGIDKDESEREPMEFREAAPTMGSVANMIGTKNLLIIIVTMPFVFLVVVMAIIAIFGSPDQRGEDALTASTPGAVRSTPIASLEEPAANGRVVLPLPAAVGELGAAIALPEGAETGAMALDGDRLAMRVDTSDGAMIVIYDLSSDQVVKTISLVAESDD